MKQRFFDICKKLSLKSNHRQHQMGAVIVEKNRVVGVGFNQLKTHSRSNHPYKSIHAELSAILNSRRETFEGCSIYIYRENKYGEKACAKPCIYCTHMLRSLGIREVFYTSNGQYIKGTI